MGLTLAGFAGAQTMTEFGAAAATGTVGGASGKKVSEGITAIFGKVDESAKAAAKEDPSKTDKASTAAVTLSPAPSPSPAPAPGPAAAPGPATASTPAAAKTAKAKPAAQPSAKTTKSDNPGMVPDPPALPSRPVVVSKAPEPVAPPQPAIEVAAVIPPPPPPPEMTAADLKTVTPGTKREDLIKLGAPASRITMFSDEGHLLEIYSYVTKGATFGVVRLNDGAVSKVELR